MSYGIKVEGLRELVKDAESLGVEVSDLKRAFGDIAEEGAHLAADFAPHRTGRLEASIRPSKAKNYAAIRAGGARVPYAGRVNYQRGFSRLGYHFLQRASDVLEPTVGPRIVADIDRLIRERGLQP